MSTGRSKYRIKQTVRKIEFNSKFSVISPYYHMSNTNTHGIRHGAETIHPLFLDNKFVHVYSHKMTKTLNVIFI